MELLGVGIILNSFGMRRWSWFLICLISRLGMITGGLLVFSRTGELLGGVMVNNTY